MLLFRGNSPQIAHKDFSFSKKELSSVCFTFFWALFFTACLPVDTEQPECFPDEGCPINLECVEGRCVSPPKYEVNLSVNCLGGTGCYDQLTAYQFEQACLVIEQPEMLFSIPFNFAQAREAHTLLEIELKKAPIRASIVLLYRQHEDLMSMEQEETLACPQSPEALRESRFHESCLADKHCLLRLRTLLIDQSQVLANTQIVMDFGGPEGQCIESQWNDTIEIEESCSAQDLDCDGFFDEGLVCEGEQQ